MKRTNERDREMITRGEVKALIVTAFVAFGVLTVASNLATNEFYDERADQRADRTVERIDERSYRRSIEACRRGNRTARRPLHDFLVAFARDERTETDDEELLQAIRRGKARTGDIPCEKRVNAPQEVP